MRGFYVKLLVVLTGWAVAGQGYGETGQVARGAVGFELYRGYLIVVRGAAGPVKGLNLLLDTGASPSVLDPRVARKLHLDVAPTDVAVLGGSVRGGTATAPSLGFGPVRRENVPVLVNDLSFLRKVLPVEIDGMIGLDVLGQSSFAIDYAAREIRFGPAPSLAGSAPLQMRDGRAIVDATVNHATVHLLLDTGASGLILFQAMAEAGSGGASAKTIGDFERKPVWLSSFTLGQAEFGRAAAFLVGSPKDAGHDFDGLMSPAALGITEVAVDLGGGKLAFSRER